MELKVPKLKGVPFETAIIERYRRRESSVEEALIEMYLAGVSVRRVEDITEALWGTKVSPGTISYLNKKAYEHIEAWRTRPLVGTDPSYELIAEIPIVFSSKTSKSTFTVSRDVSIVILFSVAHRRMAAPSS